MPVQKVLGSSQFMASGGYALWTFKSDAWELMKSDCAEGYIPGGPPIQQGKFDGEVVKKPCEPDLVVAQKPLGGG